jgi:hypothetical protein
MGESLMPGYLVLWEIEVIADSPEDAAREAQKIQRDRDSIATVYDVAPIDGGAVIRVDLMFPAEVG